MRSWLKFDVLFRTAPCLESPLEILGLKWGVSVFYLFEAGEKHALMKQAVLLFLVPFFNLVVGIMVWTTAIFALNGIEFPGRI